MLQINNIKTYHSQPLKTTNKTYANIVSFTGNRDEETTHYNTNQNAYKSIMLAATLMATVLAGGGCGKPFDADEAAALVTTETANNKELDRAIRQSRNLWVARESTKELTGDISPKNINIKKSTVVNRKTTTTRLSGNCENLRVDLELIKDEKYSAIIGDFGSNRIVFIHKKTEPECYFRSINNEKPNEKNIQFLTDFFVKSGMGELMQEESDFLSMIALNNDCLNSIDPSVRERIYIHKLNQYDEEVPKVYFNVINSISKQKNAQAMEFEITPDNSVHIKGEFKGKEVNLQLKSENSIKYISGKILGDEVILGVDYNNYSLIRMVNGKPTNNLKKYEDFIKSIPYIVNNNERVLKEHSYLLPDFVLVRPEEKEIAKLKKQIEELEGNQRTDIDTVAKGYAAYKLLFD